MRSLCCRVFEVNWEGWIGPLCWLYRRPWWCPHTSCTAADLGRSHQSYTCLLWSGIGTLGRHDPRVSAACWGGYVQAFFSHKSPWSRRVSPHSMTAGGMGSVRGAFLFGRVLIFCTTEGSIGGWVRVGVYTIRMLTGPTQVPRQVDRRHSVCPKGSSTLNIYTLTYTVWLKLRINDGVFQSHFS